MAAYGKGQIIIIKISENGPSDGKQYLWKDQEILVVIDTIAASVLENHIRSEDGSLTWHNSRQRPSLTEEWDTLRCGFIVLYEPSLGTLYQVNNGVTSELYTFPGYSRVYAETQKSK